MKILFISTDGDGYPLAAKLARDGSDVSWWVKAEEMKNMGAGLENPKRVSSWGSEVGKADLVIFDMVGMGKTADALRKSGKAVLGASRIADKLEFDRELGMELAERSGLQVSEFHRFDSVKEGIRFLKSTEDCYVFKPLGNKGESSTFVAKGDNEGLISYMERHAKDTGPYVLQRCVNGVEVSTEGFFDGRRFLRPFNHTFERKRLMNGDHGPNTGCAGNVVFVTEGDEITDQALLPLEPILQEYGYRGPWDVNAIVNEEGIWFVENTDRFGYAAIYASYPLIKGDRAKFFLEVATGKDQGEWDFSEDFGMAVTVSMPPYPDYEDRKRVKELAGEKVVKVGEADEEDVWLADVEYQNGKPVMAGADGLVGYVSGTGADLEELRGEVYDRIDRIALVRDLQYRTDIGERVEGDMKKLEGWGYL